MDPKQNDEKSNTKSNESSRFFYFIQLITNTNQTNDDSHVGDDNQTHVLQPESPDNSLSKNESDDQNNLTNSNQPPDGQRNSEDKPNNESIISSEIEESDSLPQNDELKEDALIIDGDEDTSITPQHIKVEKHGMKDGVIDFVAGSLAGIAQVYVSQPLDTVKVKLQTFPKLYKGIYHCLMMTYNTHGIARGLYAGTAPAVAASVAENSVLFAAYGSCQSAVAAVSNTSNIKDLSMFQNACAGSLAAFFSTLTLCPTELVKCKLQAIQEVKRYVSKDSLVAAITPFQLTKQILEKEGIAGFYRGLSSTYAREVPGFFFFFGSYEGTREFLIKEGQTKDDLNAWQTMFAGAVGGMTLWTSTFPADVIKSRIQIQNLKSSMARVAIDIIRTEGILALYNGLLASLIRTIPATATLFLIYESTKKFLNKYL